MLWRVYLSGEIHSAWREVIRSRCAKLPVSLSAPNLSHEDSDDCGAVILGDEATRQNYDNKGARLNLIRTRTLIDNADIVVVRFGEKYRQWNAAFEAGYATAKGKALVTVHPSELGHALKEVDATALAVCERPDQVAEVLEYVINGTLPPFPAGFVPMASRAAGGPGNPNP
ncbi:hypothetical protein CTAYLR_006177 [Chrysophaeum taylorii]|uniref:YtoQ family protein n=1 Tax=Chrysophaeum taylorii TaxID=2483200 RepID=A0AAD7UNC8_9STRA|nr:hypothetical protein CTAYLR_006177 [Chrysophaeum taylorii]